jgi:hypothetical protein
MLELKGLAGTHQDKYHNGFILPFDRRGKKKGRPEAERLDKNVNLFSLQ